MDRRKELKKAYKENPPAKGVYQIRNTINGKIFVGSSMNLHGTSNSWKGKLATNWHPCKALQAEWNTSGGDAFVFEILETLNLLDFPQDDWRMAVGILEEQWLEKLQPYDDKGYNPRKN